MTNSMRGRANGSNRLQHDKVKQQSQLQQDNNRNYKQAIGTISEIDPGGKGRLTIKALVTTSAGTKRLWGEGRHPIVLLDSPLDILMRFGALRPGMQVLISWRGISETGKAYARILNETATDESIRRGEQIPQREVDTQSSLPFEPFGF